MNLRGRKDKDHIGLTDLTDVLNAIVGRSIDLYHI